jgi:hypothetical protein
MTNIYVVTPSKDKMAEVKDIFNAVGSPVEILDETKTMLRVSSDSQLKDIQQLVGGLGAVVRETIPDLGLPKQAPPKPF